MNKNMMRRRAAMSLSLGFLASCSTPKTKIVGVQIPVLPETTGFDVTAAAPVVSVPAAVALDAWPQQLANAAHAPGNVAGPEGLKAGWTASVGTGGGYRQPLLASPLLAEGKVFAMDANAVVTAHSASDGRPDWRRVTRPKHATENNIGGGIGYDGGRIYASTGYGELLALDAGSGAVLWRQTLDFPTRTAPVIAGGVVYGIGLGNTAMAVDLHSGAKVWTHAATGTQPYCAAGGFAFLLDKNQVLTAIHADDGLTSWSLQMPIYLRPKVKETPLLWTGPVMVNGALVLTNNLGRIAFVDPVAGKIKAIARLRGPADMAPIAAGGLLVQLTRDGMLTAYS